MNIQISLEAKKIFLGWFLDRHQLKRRESMWILNYLLNHDIVLNKVHFIEAAEKTPRGMMMSTMGTNTEPFLFYKNGTLFSDPEQAFHEVRLNWQEDMYIELVFSEPWKSAEYLTVLEDNPYFINLLEPFYQSKPVEFDESLLVEMEETSQNEKTEVEDIAETPALPSNLESLVKKGTDVLEQKETLVPIEITESSNTLSEEKNLEYEQEIERLKLELEAKNDLLAKQVQKEKEIVEFQKVVQVENTKDIPVSNEFPDIVGSALQSRLTQLEQEIKQRDTRSHIKESIVNDFQDKKKKAIENKLIELEIEKNVKLEKPKADYELLVKQIGDEHNQIKEKEMKNITDYYEKECQIKIKNETEKHSEELANYLNERKNELLNWQKSFNNDIESQLGSMYYVFQLPVEE